MHKYKGFPKEVERKHLPNNCKAFLNYKNSANSFYFLKQIQPSGCDNYGVDDDGHIPLDSDKEWNFYDADNNPYFRELPGYRDYVGSENVTLFARKRIEFKSNRDVCSTFNYQSLKDVANDLNVFENLRLACNITSYALFSIAVLILILVGFQKGRPSTVVAGLVSVASMNAIILVILCAVALSYISAIDSNSGLMNEVANNDCFKIQGYNTLFKNLQNYILVSYPDEKSYNSTNLIISVSFFAMSFVLIIVMVTCQCISKHF